jgi:SAM-dependent methyltransferase
LRGLLEIPWLYRTFQRVVGGDYWRKYLERYVRPQAGEKVLDLGCGPADILEFLTGTRYTGIDLDASYIGAARARFGDRGVFKCQSIVDAVVDEPASFDVVLANGVLHHLDDSEVGALFGVAVAALKPTGRFVSFDGCWIDGQSWIARSLLARDRGLHIRTADAYVALASGAFSAVDATLVHDLLRVPYTHLVLQCRQRKNAPLAQS